MTDSPRNVLITGGTGLVGSHLAEWLIDKGYKVRCLLRYPDKRRWLGDLPVEVIPGDITIPSTLPDAVDGVDAVVHAAALLKTKSRSDFYRFNAQGTRHLIDACLNASSPPKRFIYCSTIAASGPAPSGRPITAFDPPHPLTDYGKSKLEGENEVTRFKDRIETVIIRPAAVFGPRDKDVFLFFRTMASWHIKPFFGSPKHIVSLIYVKDLVDVLVKALEAPASQLPAQPLFAADPCPYTWEEVAAIVEKSLNRKCASIVIPAPIVSIVAAIFELFSGNNPGAFNRQKAKEMLASSWWCDAKPTMESLKWNSITPLETAIQDTIDWYRAQRWIK